MIAVIDSTSLPNPQEMVHHIRHLPTLPSIANQLLKLLESETSSAHEIEQILQHDQSLCGALLEAANSSYYATSQEVTTVQRAVVVLGNDEVRKICLGAGLCNLMGKQFFSDLRQAEDLWKHALSVAEAAYIIAEYSGKVDPHTAYTAGLMHDLGRVVVAAYCPEVTSILRKLADQNHTTYRSAEVEVGWDHQDIGLRLAEHWKLPQVLCEVMARHHQPFPELKHLGMVSAVHLADCLTAGLTTELSDYADDYLPNPLAMETLNINASAMAVCCHRFLQRTEAIGEFWRTFTAGNRRTLQ